MCFEMLMCHTVSCRQTIELISWGTNDIATSLWTILTLTLLCHINAIHISGIVSVNPQCVPLVRRTVYARFKIVHRPCKVHRPCHPHRGPYLSFVNKLVILSLSLSLTFFSFTRLFQIASVLLCPGILFINFHFPFLRGCDGRLLSLHWLVW